MTSIRSGGVSLQRHLELLNRGCLIAPFHNMMLVCPSTSAPQVQQLCAAFDATAALLTTP